MEEIQIWIEQLVEACGVTGDTVNFITHTILVIIAFALAFLAGWLCRKLLIPVVLKLTKKTEARWDDVMFNERVLKSACSIVPAIIVWQLLPWTFFDFPTVREVLARLTAIYITIMSARTLIVFSDSTTQNLCWRNCRVWQKSSPERRRHWRTSLVRAIPAEYTRASYGKSANSAAKCLTDTAFPPGSQMTGDSLPPSSDGAETHI